MANLPKNLTPKPVDSPIGGEHCVVWVEHEGKWYTIDSIAKQFIRNAPTHPTGIVVEMQRIRDLDARKPMLKLMDAIDSGVFTFEQHDEFKKLCGYLGF